MHGMCPHDAFETYLQPSRLQLKPACCHMRYKGSGLQFTHEFELQLSLSLGAGLPEGVM